MLNEKIRLTLTNEGRSQTWLSEKSNIPIKTLNAFLVGRKKIISAEDYYNICKALDKPFEYFFSDENGNPRAS